MEESGAGLVTAVSSLMEGDEIPAIIGMNGVIGVMGVWGSLEINLHESALLTLVLTTRDLAADPTGTLSFARRDDTPVTMEERGTTGLIGLLAIVSLALALQASLVFIAVETRGGIWYCLRSRDSAETQLR